MAINTEDTRFRKLDVDNISETNFQQDTGDDSSTFNDREVENLLNSGKTSEALKFVLDNAPIHSRNQGVKDTAATLALRSMASMKSAQIDECIKDLNREQLDMLMKYVYRGFQTPNDITYAALLTWHEKVLAKGTISSIVRVLTDGTLV